MGAVLMYYKFFLISFPFYTMFSKPSENVYVLAVIHNHACYNKILSAELPYRGLLKYVSKNMTF